MHPITWDFDRVLLYLPLIHFPIYWYGFLFALGVYVAQRILQHNFLKNSLMDPQDYQKFVAKMVLAIICGARLFDIIFYQDLAYFLLHPLEIINFRAGGLASHGGLIGFVVSVFWYTRRRKQSMINYLSHMIAPAGILACFIRLGNLFNQEILGKAYDGFFSVIFKRPLDGSAVIPRHPVVIYEAVLYLVIGLLFQKLKLQANLKVGSSLMAFFITRIVLEIFKEEQSVYQLPFGITMGMLLSLPIVIFGLYLIFSPSCSKQYKKSQSRHP